MKLNLNIISLNRKFSKPLVCVFLITLVIGTFFGVSEVNAQTLEENLDNTKQATDNKNEDFQITQNQRFITKVIFILVLGAIFYILQGKYFKR